MATVTRIPLSGSTSGRGVLVAAVATPGTTIHTAVNTAGQIDEVYLYAINTSAAPVKLTIEWGGTTSPNDLVEVTIDGETGLVLVSPGLPANSGVVIRAFAASANLVVVHGWVNRIVN